MCLQISLIQVVFLKKKKKSDYDLEEMFYRAWTNRESFGRVHFDHSPQQVLAVRRDKVRHMEDSQLHLLQQVPQVVVVERQSTLTHTQDRE